MANILVLHGPNLNLLGRREPETYGTATLEDINHTLVQQGETVGHHVITLQSNSEAELITAIQTAPADNIAFIIINAAALTHTSIGLRDALLAVRIPFIEVHLSNTYQRETFRHHSYLADIAQGCILGFGPLSYELALTAAIKYVE